MLRTFSIGVLVDQRCSLQAWEIAMLQDCVKTGLAKKIVVLVQKQRNPLQKKNFLFWLFHRFENSWFANDEDATHKTILRKNSWINALIDADDHLAVSDLHLDIIYTGTDAFFDEKFNRYSTYGLWRVVFGEKKYFVSNLRTFWEVMHHSPVTGSQLIVYRKDAISVNVYNCSTATVPYSVKNNFNSIAWKSSSFLAYRLNELNEAGAELFFNRHQQWQPPDQKPLQQPGNLQMLFLFVRNIFRYFMYKLDEHKKKRFTMAFTTENFDIFQPEFSHFRKIDLPQHVFYADPFVIENNHQSFIFFENYNEQTGKGLISVLEPGNADQPASIKTVLEKPYHLSYPFVFEWNGNYWMIPETASAKNVQLYRCANFPDQWEFVKELLSDCILIDATVLFHQNKWWMFGVTHHHQACSTNDQLLLYYTDDLLTGKWQQHPQNPVATDIANCRPAGKVFEKNGKLYRPAQNNASFQYGYAICINEIEVLTETMYHERPVLEYLPAVNVPYKAMHTVNQSEKMTVIDAIL